MQLLKVNFNCRFQTLMVIMFLTNDPIGFQVFTVLIFWVFTPCSQGLFQHFQEMYCFHLQG